MPQVRATLTQATVDTPEAEYAAACVAYKLCHISYGVLAMPLLRPSTQQHAWHISYGILVMAYWLCHS